VNAFLRTLESDLCHDLAAVSMIGRSPECSIILGDARVSRRHAMIRRQDGAYYLFDLGSFNGSYLNGMRVTAGRPLKPGDVVSFSEHEFVFEQGDHEASPTPIDELGGSTIALIRSSPAIILVSDIKGFTALSEELEPDDLAQVIGGWYSDCELIISREGGTVDKFIGDCVLAYWTKVDRATAAAALRVGEALLLSCGRIYQQHPDIFEKTTRRFEVGVGIHSGKVAHGGMSQGEHTLIGDPVNLTFRLESLTRTLPENLLVSGDFGRCFEDAPARFRSLGVHSLKGRAQGVEVMAQRS